MTTGRQSQEPEISPKQTNKKVLFLHIIKEGKTHIKKKSSKQINLPTWHQGFLIFFVQTHG